MNDNSAEGPVARTMRAKLTAAFEPDALTITDESEQHRGHAGHREGGESHFHVAIRSAAFAPMSRVDRHRAVNAALAEELAGPVHALRLTVSAE
ncbi:MAG: BolA family protein [Pseudomonadota bacterium]